MANYDGHQAKRMKTDADMGDDQPAFFNYSSNQRRNDDESRANHVLLMTVINPAYPITVDVIHTITSPIGKVLRIVIFKKNGVQAMVEFENVSIARRAKQSLNGADIYSGCCTLKIEYAKPEKLNVYKNDSDSWDYTNPNLGKNQSNEGQRQGPLLQDPPRFGAAPQPYRDGSSRQSSGRGRGGHRNFGGSTPEYDQYSSGHNQYDSYESDNYGGPSERFGGRDNYRNGNQRGSGHHGSPYNSPSNGGGNDQGSVMMVYGMCPEKMNCDRVFNVFCLYGNVLKIKFLKTKEGCAMVQMSDPVSIDRAVYSLNNVEFFNRKMQLAYSKQAFLNDVHNPFELPDGTSSFKDYMNSRNNRYMNADAASKNRISSPSKMVHFFNTPYGVTEDELKLVFDEHVINPPVMIKMFTSKTERSSSGLMEFSCISDSIEAVATCNHAPISSQSSKYPFVMKLCFSSSGPRS